MRHDKSRDDKGKVKLRFIEFEIDASNATLQDTLRNIATAIGRGGTHTRAHDSNPRQLTPAPATIDSTETNGASTAQEESFQDTQLADSASESRPSRRSAPRPPKILTDLDLTSGGTPFEDYFKSKKPDTDSQRYLVVVGWLKEFRDITEVTMDHVYTCYRFLSLNPPKDTTAPLRGMKKQGWFNKGTSKGSYILNQIGLNELSKLGKGN